MIKTVATLRSVLRRFRGRPSRLEPQTVVAPTDERDDGEDFRKLRVGFTAAVSHELRTPLARLSALLDGADLPDADLAGIVGAARDEVRRMTEIVNDVLFLSEVETGREVVSLQATTVLPVLEEVVAALGERARLAGIELVVVAASDAQVPIRARLLRTIIENLAENVLRHGRGATRCWLSARREGGQTLLSVVDNGVGVPEDELGRIFERFYRRDESRASAGSGLGLAIVKHVVSAAGGDVEALPGPGGVGLEIRCTFPG